MKLVFEQVIDGEEFEVPPEWYIGCCHCGLVHLLRFRTKKGKWMIRVTGETALTRAHRKELGVKVVKIKPSRGKMKVKKRRTRKTQRTI